MKGRVSWQTYDAQGEMEQNDLQIRQKPNTEGLLSDYLHSANIKEDTIFAVLYSLAECFRCEAAIPAFYAVLPSNIPEKPDFPSEATPDHTSIPHYPSVTVSSFPCFLLL